MNVIHRTLGDVPSVPLSSPCYGGVLKELAANKGKSFIVYQDEYESVIAQSYDSVYSVVRDPSGDIGFYVDRARTANGPLLELGCGTGRILLPTAATGVQCVGLDASPEMLSVLRAKGLPENVELVAGRLESFDLGDARFGLITAPFRVMQHMLDVDTQLRALENIRRHLAPGGEFVFDIFDPNPASLTATEQPEVLDSEFTHNGAAMRRYAQVSRDITTQVLTVSFRLDGGPKHLQGSSQIQLRWYYRFEIEHLLVRAGFSQLEFLGGFDGGPWEAGKDIVVVARA